MPNVKEWPITEEWLARVRRQMREKEISASDLARDIGTSPAAIYYVLTRAKTSLFVPRIDAALAGNPVRIERYDPLCVAETAQLVEARDAVRADIARLEVARQAIEQRLAEAHEHEANLHMKIAELRARRSRHTEPPPGES